MAWIGIDAGTSVIKSVAFADDGLELAVARRPTTVLHPQEGFSEQRMDEVWQAVVDTVCSVRAQIDEQIRGIASTAQGDGAWLVDERGNPAGNAILWNDGRSAAIVERWRAQGLIERSARISGSVTYPGLPNAIFAWLSANEPDLLERARWLLTCNAWVHSRLTGRFVADLSDASNPFGDVCRGNYSESVLALYGMESYAHLLPPIVRKESACAGLSPEAADRLGLAAGIPVVMAPYDIASTAIGCGAVRAGQSCVILGTTVCTETLVDALDLSSSPAGTTIALDDGLFLRAMPTLTGCEALDWAAYILGADSLGKFGEIAAQAEPGCGGVVFLPYLSPAGERSPFLDPAARGSYHGVSLLTGRAQLARAVYEGLSFVIRECLEAATPMAPDEIHVCGGGARSELWCQTIADVTGSTVTRTADAETGARGAYLFALAATGRIASLGEGVRSLSPAKTTFLPSEQRAGFYASRYAVFRDLRDMARKQWSRTAEER